MFDSSLLFYFQEGIKAALVRFGAARAVPSKTAASLSETGPAKKEEQQKPPAVTTLIEDERDYEVRGEKQ